MPILFLIVLNWSLFKLHLIIAQARRVLSNLDVKYFYYLDRDYRTIFVDIFSITVNGFIVDGVNINASTNDDYIAENAAGRFIAGGWYKPY